MATVVNKEITKTYSAKLSTGRLFTITENNFCYNFCIDKNNPEDYLIHPEDLHTIKDVLVEAINDKSN